MMVVLTGPILVERAPGWRAGGLDVSVGVSVGHDPEAIVHRPVGDGTGRSGAHSQRKTRTAMNPTTTA